MEQIPSNRDSPSPRRLLDFRSGGWVIALAAVVMLAVVARLAMLVVESRRKGLVGDGRNAESYGFDLSTTSVPADRIVAAGMPKDGLKALVDPAHIDAAWVEELNDAMRGGEITRSRYLVPNDPVIGVAIDGAARAYPLDMFYLCEIVNDTLGGRPIAATFNPLSGGIVAFDRRVAGRTREFGVSGLLYNSNLLMYDRQPAPAEESLWSQLLFRAVAGPAVAEGPELDVLPCALTRWDDWLARHPQTTVMVPEPLRAWAQWRGSPEWRPGAAPPERPFLGMAYKERPYTTYFASEQIKFPLEPPPPPGGPKAKEMTLAVRIEGQWRAFPFAALAAQSKGTGVVSMDYASTRLIIHPRADVPALGFGVAWAETEPPEALEATAYAFWFAWNAMREGDGRAE